MSYGKGAWDEMGVPAVKVPRKPTIPRWERPIFVLLLLGWLIAAVAAGVSVYGIDMANTAVAKAQKLTRDLETCQTGILQSYPPCLSKKKGNSEKCLAFVSQMCFIDNINALQHENEAEAKRWRDIAKVARYPAWLLSVGTTLLFYVLRLLLTGRLRPLWPLGKHD